ncbi:hypothetical protein B0H12DRAFT_331799 [Mycena haematopus]|nr:hypothetical protein B0H12DRAFT_331799 [Mycena haematopus]
MYSWPANAMLLNIAFLKVLQGAGCSMFTFALLAAFTKWCFQQFIEYRNLGTQLRAWPSHERHVGHSLGSIARPSCGAV